MHMSIWVSTQKTIPSEYHANLFLYYPYIYNCSKPFIKLKKKNPVQIHLLSKNLLSRRAPHQRHAAASLAPASSCKAPSSSPDTYQSQQKDIYPNQIKSSVYPLKGLCNRLSHGQSSRFCLNFSQKT